MDEDNRSAAVSAYLSGGFVSEVARGFGMSRKTVRRLLEEAGVPLRESRSRAPSKDVLLDLYVNQGMSAKQVGEVIGRSHQSVLNYLKRAGITSRPVGGKEAKPPGRDVLVDMYVRRNMTIPEMCKTLSVSLRVVGRWVREAGIERRKRRRPGHVPTKLKSPGREILEDLYVTRRMTYAQIGEALGVKPCTITRWMRQEGIRNRFGTRPMAGSASDPARGL